MINIRQSNLAKESISYKTDESLAFIAKLVVDLLTPLKRDTLILEVPSTPHPWLKVGEMIG